MMLRISESEPHPTPASVKHGSHVVYLNGVNLHYQVKGDGPLLFVVSPGWGVGSGYLQRGLDFLTARFTVVFVDTRGSGLSGRPADDALMGSNEMADDLNALRAHLGLSTIMLLGHSNGGAIAMAFALRHRERVSKLLLIDSQVFGINASEDTQAFLRARAKDPDYERAVHLADGLFSGKHAPPMNDEELSAFVTNILALYLANPARHLDEARRQLLLGQISFYAFSHQNAADALARNDHAQSLDLLKIPVFIASGRHDWICPVAVAERLHAGIENANLVIFEDSGHLPWIEEPDRFKQTLFGFLTPP